VATTEKTFHGLKLLARCGGGAYGDVYYCEDISGKRQALKVISKKRLGAAWQRELQGVMNYRRITEDAPHLLRILYVAEDEDTFYYTMEAADSASSVGYVSDTLAQRLQSGPLPPEQLYPILRCIFDGIKTIHDAGFAHRDIKPENILFVNGVPKLGDIGLLSSLSNTMSTLAGTLEFLPPEVRAADSPESSDRASRQRSDLYAFGKVIYCAATGLEPGMYPSMPTGAKLSRELKFFWRLASKLCAREPRLRLGDVAKLERAFEQIGRQIASGETLADRLSFILDGLSRNLLSCLLTAVSALRKIWWLPILPALVGAAVWAYHIHTERKSALEHPGTKIYAIKSLGLKMRIPSHWEAMSESHIRAQAAEMTKELNETDKGEEAKQLLRHSIEMAKTWNGLIRCDMYDVIEISRRKSSVAETNRLWTIPQEELKRLILAQYAMAQSGEAKAYEMQRIMLAGRRCLTIELSITRHDRIKNCIILDDDGVIIIALTADATTFPRRRMEFDAALKTLEFTARRHGG